jgi:hypothetical protein
LCVRTAPNASTCAPNAAEIAALDYLAVKWSTSHSDVIRSLVVGAALGELDRLDALDTADEGFDLIDAPVDDVLAAP